MALASIGGLIAYPPLPWNPLVVGGGFSTTQMVLDASGERVAWVLTATTAGTIKKIGFLCGTVANTAAGVTVKIEGIDATSGDPDGSVADSVTGVAVASDTWVTATLPSGVAVDAGEQVYAIVEFTSFSAGDSVVIKHWYSGGLVRGMYNHAAYCSQYAASAWAKQASVHPNCYVEYSDTSVAPFVGVYPASSATFSQVLDTGQDPDEAGLYIAALPFKARCVGVWAYISPANGATLQLSLLDGTDTVLGQYAAPWDEDYGTESLQGGIVCPFTPVTLAAAGTYRVIVTPQGVEDVSLYRVDVAAAGHLGMYAGGTGCHWTQRTDAGAWSQTTTRRPMVGLLLDQLDDGAGGSYAGSLLWGDRTGGLR